MTRSRIVAVGAVVALAAAAIGFLARGWLVAPGPSVVGEARGSVTIVNGAGTAICLAPAGGGEPLCSGLWLSGGQAAPRVGDRIRVWIVRVPLEDGGAEDHLIVAGPT